VPYRWLQAALLLVARRGIHAYEVMQVLSCQHRRVVPAVDPVTGLVLRSVWGVTAAGRGIIVVVRPAAGWDAVIVGARDMTGPEREDYDTWVSTR
jgi:hypothetical protein